MKQLIGKNNLKKYYYNSKKDNDIITKTIDEAYCNDREMFMFAMRQNSSFAVFHGFKYFRSDKEFMMKAVKRDGFFLAEASPEIRGD